MRNINKVQAAVQAIPEHAWQTIPYPDGGQAQIAETIYAGRRLIVRRTRLLGPQAELFPDWRHFAFVTNRTDDITIVEAEHRDHAVVEQVIADLKDQALAHFPSGHFHANAAWTVLAAIAHNLLRWTQQLGLPETTVRAARTTPPPTAQHPRPPHTPRTRLDTAPTRPLALARRLHQRAQPRPRAARRRLTTNRRDHRQPQHISPAGRHQRCPKQSKKRSRGNAATSQPPHSILQTDLPDAATTRTADSPKPSHRIGGSGLRARAR